MTNIESEFYSDNFYLWKSAAHKDIWTVHEAILIAHDVEKPWSLGDEFRPHYGSGLSTYRAVLEFVLLAIKEKDLATVQQGVKVQNPNAETMVEASAFATWGVKVWGESRVPGLANLLRNFHAVCKVADSDFLSSRLHYPFWAIGDAASYSHGVTGKWTSDGAVTPEFGLKMSYDEVINIIKMATDDDLAAVQREGTMWIRPRDFLPWAKLRGWNLPTVFDEYSQKTLASIEKEGDEEEIIFEDYEKTFVDKIPSMKHDVLKAILGALLARYCLRSDSKLNAKKLGQKLEGSEFWTDFHVTPRSLSRYIGVARGARGDSGRPAN